LSSMPGQEIIKDPAERTSLGTKTRALRDGQLEGCLPSWLVCDPIMKEMVAVGDFLSDVIIRQLDTIRGLSPEERKDTMKFGAFQINSDAVSNQLVGFWQGFDPYRQKPCDIDTVLRQAASEVAPKDIKQRDLIYTDARLLLLRGELPMPQLHYHRIAKGCGATTGFVTLRPAKYIALDV